jgi:dTMP kinase
VKRRRGLFLVLEGLDGAGTTTQAQQLATWLKARGRRIHLTAEPSRGPIGTQVRHVLSGRVRGARGRDFDPRSLALLFAADRLDHWESEIDPRLEEGCDVISDRYVLSSLAYQAVSTGDAPWVAAINSMAPAADLTVFLRVAPAVALRRRYAAGSEREIFEFPDFQRKVHRAYVRALAGMVDAGERVVEVRGEGTIEAIGNAVTRAVEPLLP